MHFLDYSCNRPCLALSTPTKSLACKFLPAWQTVFSSPPSLLHPTAQPSYHQRCDGGAHQTRKNLRWFLPFYTSVDISSRRAYKSCQTPTRQSLVLKNFQIITAYRFCIQPLLRALQVLYRNCPSCIYDPQLILSTSYRITLSPPCRWYSLYLHVISTVCNVKMNSYTLNE